MDGMSRLDGQANHGNAVATTAGRTKFEATRNVCHELGMFVPSMLRTHNAASNPATVVHAQAGMYETPA